MVDDIELESIGFCLIFREGKVKYLVWIWMVIIMLLLLLLYCYYYYDYYYYIIFLLD